MAKPEPSPCPHCNKPLPERLPSDFSGLYQGATADFSGALEAWKSFNAKLRVGSRARIGRPLKPTAEGERAPLGLKVPPKLKERLDQAARSSGRSQSMEAEARLEMSFDRVDLLPDVLRMAYGEDVAVALAFLGLLMSTAKIRGADGLDPSELHMAVTILRGTALGVSLRPVLQSKEFDELIAGPEGEPIRQLLERAERTSRSGSPVKITGKITGRWARRTATGELVQHRKDRPAKRRSEA